jgi:DNA-binding beta-propeller fold protein YncE
MDEALERANPFPGLRPFTEEEDYLFFGREAQGAELLRRLRQARFLAVVGTSGSGKSSLVMAGVLPALHGGLMTQAGSRWRVALFRPGSNPIGALAHALSQPHVLGATDRDSEVQVIPQTVIIETTLRRSALGLVEVVQQARRPAGENLLVVVDQFEELFRFRATAQGAQGSDDAAAFVKLLLEASRTPTPPIYVVLTMRSDFLGDCAQFRDLPEAINDGQFLIPRMTRDQRRQAIEGPVAVGGAAMTPRLVQRLLNDVGDNPDQLPILQHALMRTWDKWQENGAKAIDLPHYEAIGGMGEALSQHADEIFAALPGDRSRVVAEKLFRALTDTGTDHRGLRRPTRLSELCVVTSATTAEVVTVIEAFRQPGSSFLVPPVPTPLTDDSVVDISHESLMRVWERLKTWTEQEAQSARVYRRLAETAGLHTEGKAGLWRDPDLQVALDWRDKEQPTEEWARRYHRGFAHAMRFLEASVARRKEEAREQAEAQRAKARLQRTIIWALTAVVLIVLGFAAFAWQQKNYAEAQKAEAEAQRAEAERQRTEAQAQKAEAERQRTEAETQRVEAEKQKTEAEAQRVEAEARRAEAVEQRNRAAQATTAAQKSKKEAEVQRDAAKKAEQKEKSANEQAREAFEREKRTIAESAKKEQLAELRGRDTQLASARLAADARSVVKDRLPLALLLSIAANALADIGESKGSLLEALLSSSSIDSLRTGLPGHTESVRSIVFSPDGKLLASGSGDQTIQLWDIAARKPLATLQTDDIVRRVSFSRDGKLLAAAVGKTVHLWDVVTGAKLDTLPKQGDKVRSIAFSPDGKLLASGNEDSTIRLWDVTKKLELGAPLHEHKKAISALVFSPDGKLFVSGSEDNTIRLWDAVTLQSVGVLTGHQGPVRSIALSPDGKLLASGSEDSTIRLWDVATKQSRGIFFPDHRDTVRTVAFSPDGKLLASGSEDNTVRLWDVATRRQLGTSLTGNKDTVRSVAFSPDGKLLASGSQDGALGLWDVSLESWKNQACRLAKATLTQDQWKLYVGGDVEYRDICPGQPPFVDVSTAARRATRQKKEGE